MDDLAVEARSRAGSNYKKGYNCAESILHAFNEMLNNPLNPENLTIVTGFGGGLGNSGCSCGALTGSVMILGLLKGRLDPSQSREPCYDVVHEFHDRFSDEYGGTCCRILNPHDYDSPEHLRRCLKITGGTAKLLMEFIQEKKLVDSQFNWNI